MCIGEAEHWAERIQPGTHESILRWNGKNWTETVVLTPVDTAWPKEERRYIESSLVGRVDTRKFKLKNTTPISEWNNSAKRVRELAEFVRAALRELNE